MDDTFTIIKSSQKTSFLEHFKTIDQHIQFNSEESRQEGSMPFLNILITPKEDGSLSTTVYRKPTHTDLYLQRDSNHTVSSKYSVVVHFITELKPSIPALNCCNKRKNI